MKLVFIQILAIYLSLNLILPTIFVDGATAEPMHSFADPFIDCVLKDTQFLDEATSRGVRESIKIAFKQALEKATVENFQKIQKFVLAAIPGENTLAKVMCVSKAMAPVFVFASTVIVSRSIVSGMHSELDENLKDLKSKWESIESLLMVYHSMNEEQRDGFLLKFKFFANAFNNEIESNSDLRATIAARGFTIAGVTALYGALAFAIGPLGVLTCAVAASKALTLVGAGFLGSGIYIYNENINISKKSCKELKLVMKNCETMNDHFQVSTFDCDVFRNSYKEHCTHESFFWFL